MIPSSLPSEKIQIMSGKVCLRSKGKTLLGFVNKLLKTKNLFKSPSNVLPKLNFSANNLNFHSRWWDWIQAIFLYLFYFKKNLIPSGSGKLKNPGILRSHSKPVMWSFLQGHCPEVASQMKLDDPSSLQLHSENKLKKISLI